MGQDIFVQISVTEKAREQTELISVWRAVK